MSRQTLRTKVFIEEIRRNLKDEDWLNDQTETEWQTLVKQLVAELEEYIWLREESES